MTLRFKLFLLIAGITIFSTTGVTAVALWRELLRGQELLYREGAAVAAQLARPATAHAGSPSAAPGAREALEPLLARLVQDAPLARAWVVDRSGAVVVCASRNGQPCPSGVPTEFAPAEAPIQALVRLMHSEGLVTGAPILTEAGLVGAVRVDFTQSEVVGSARALTWSTAIVAAFWILLGQTFAGILLSSLTRSVDRVVEAAEALGREESGLQLDVPGDRELADLVNAFNRMSARLKERRDENLRLIEVSLAWLRAEGRRVIYDAEHFFDGFRADAGYALETLRAAVRGGAETVVLCDTNGGSLPWQITDVVRQVGSAVGHPFGVHTHNDGECAVANTLAAVAEGATQVQGTINGYGERCGNANLCSIIPALELKLRKPCLPEGRLRTLREVSQFVAEVANLAPDEHLPYVGKSAFAHKGGIHVAAMRRNESSYQHIDPALVGNEMRVVVSELSGRGNLLSKAEEYGLDARGRDVGTLLNEIKDLEAKGFSFEAAEASVAMMMKRQEPGYQAPFELIDFLVTVEHRTGRGLFAEAMVKVRVGGEVVHTAAEGDGPVDALDAALRKALLPHYPDVAKLHLADYKVRILDSSNGTAATTRVLIDTQKAGRRWSTVGASTNIIEASWRALVDSIEYGLTLAA
jgi:2-isopropylmalate synthase